MHKVTYRQKNAFSMLELVFVIVILGIVSSIGAEVIAKVYESYVMERATHRSSLKTNLAATQIANRLAYAIPGTAIGRKSDGNYTSIEELDTSDYSILQWIGYDNDSFSAQRVPGWSGFADIGLEATLTDASISKLSTPGSALGTTDTIITSLGGGGITDAAIFFPSTFTVNNIGYGGAGGTAGTFPVISEAADRLGVALAGKTIQEHYKLAWSSYAIVPLLRDGTTSCTPDTVSNQICDLHLYYNFQPWLGEAYSDGLHEVLVRNVSVFRFTGSPSSVRFKICQQEKISSTYKITTCKEKAVIR
jgi:prepilin-type N-terminal cleavage/methylation domain-containing protein